MLVWMNSAGPSIERSTWDSAARCITAVGRNAAKTSSKQDRSVADIYLVKAVARRVSDRGKRFEIAGISELVDVGDVVRRAVDQVPDHGRADKPGAAGYEYPHYLPSANGPSQ